MKAAVVERYGDADVVRVRDVDDPRPRPGQVVVAVKATAVTVADARIRGSRFPAGFLIPARLAFGVVKPRRAILGSSLAGVVAEVGPDVTDIAVGDRVAGMAGMGMGAHAERATVKAANLVRLDDGVPCESAAAVLFGGVTAQHFFTRVAPVTAGASVLINGASGAVGTSAVQLARMRGAEVTALCSAANAELVRQLGASHVIDYHVTPLGSLSETFDVVLDAVGNLSGSVAKALLKPGGVAILAAADLGQTLRARGNIKAGPAPERREDVESILRLLAEGRLDPMIESVVSLDEIAAAHRRIDTGHKVGNIIVCP